MEKSSIFICSKGYLGSHFLAEYFHRFSSVKYSQRNANDGFCFTLGAEISEKMLEAILESDYLLFCLPPSALHYEPSFYELIQKLVDKKFEGNFIFISSTSVFSENQGEVDESSNPIPTTTNGKILLNCENYLRTSGLKSWNIIRPAGIIGPERHPANFFKTNVLPSPSAPLNLILVNDLGKIIMRVIELKLNKEVIHAVQATNLSKKDFYQLAREKIKGEILSAGTNTDSVTKKIVSIKLKHVLKYDFLYPTIEECLNHL